MCLRCKKMSPPQIKVEWKNTHSNTSFITQFGQISMGLDEMTHGCLMSSWSCSKQRNNQPTKGASTPLPRLQMPVIGSMGERSVSTTQVSPSTSEGRKKITVSCHILIMTWKLLALINSNR